MNPQHPRDSPGGPNIGIKIGDVAITPILEVDTPISATFLLPDATPENLKPHVDWLSPIWLTEDFRLRLAIQALLIESRGQKIIVDTCIGNDKKRDHPAWNELDGPFLSQIAEAGFPREEVDLVVCTHLHVDHVGWNTMLVNGQWTPTFPNARYLFTQAEWDHWKGSDDPAIGDSVLPIFEAGLVDRVEVNHRINPELRFLPTPGHTPGHSSVAITSGSEEGVITGDIMHHPSQCAHPEWACSFDNDPDEARRTRIEFMQRFAGTGLPIIGTHWGPEAVQLVEHGKRWRVAR